MKEQQISGTKRKPFVKVYPGYGHTGNLVVYGHVFRKETGSFKKTDRSFIGNFIQLLQLFMVKPLPGVALVLRFYDQVLYGTTEYDGFFRFEWQSGISLSAGWHPVTIDCINNKGQLLDSGIGSILVPHITQYAFISDIDDTVLKSYSSTLFRRLYELLARNPEQRRVFIETVQHYKLLAMAQTHSDIPNPMFYVSSSEWNLYEYIRNIFRHNELPEGIFLLNQIKQWYRLLATGKSGHEGKLMRISRILQAFPKQRFVLIGDNSQKDPVIYKAIADKYPGQIHAIYIRKVRESKIESTMSLLETVVQKGVHVCMFTHSVEAIAHSRRIGLIS